MRILAIETSCDDSCVAVLDTEKNQLLSDVVHSHTASFKKWGGIVPEIASREHLKALPLALNEALLEAQLKLSEIDWIAVTHRPGLIGALLVGVSYAKGLAFALGKPFSVLNHIEAHLYSPLLASLDGQSEVPPFPWVTLVVSGGHTELFYVKNETQFEWLGGTLDDAAGEAFDKVGKLIDLPYPAGPLIDKWVREKAKPLDRTIAFPRAKVKDFEFSFSGLKTSVMLHLQSLGSPTEEQKLQVVASAQEAIVDALADKVKKALDKFPGATAVITGGVACNSRLREKLKGAYFPSPKHCTDNAAMVAILAALKFKQKTLEAAPWSATAHASFS